MSSSQPAPVERDSRGILDLWLLRQRVRLTRYPASPALAGFVDRFWAVRWDLPPGVVHRQQVLTHPGANISVGNADARPGDREAGPIGLGQAVGIGEAALTEAITSEPDEAARVGVLAAALEQAVDPQRVQPASEVADLARLAETSRAIRHLADLCAAAGLGQRTLQRMFLHYAGVSPTWVIRRYRLLEAAEAVRDGSAVSWVQLAADLGYADQAHLIRDFRAAIGQTPARYAQAHSSR